jgi:hypothetical protein
MLDRLGTGFEALLDVDKDGANYRDILSDPCKCVRKPLDVEQDATAAEQQISAARQ